MLLEQKNQTSEQKRNLSTVRLLYKQRYYDEAWKFACKHYDDFTVDQQRKIMLACVSKKVDCSNKNII
jgi:hypothetical protein